MGFWRKDFSNDEIAFVLGKIKEIRQVAKDGQISLVGGEAERWTEILITASGFAVKSDALKARIIQKVLFSPDLPKEFSEAEFKKVAYKLRHSFENEDVKALKVVFPIWHLPKFLHGRRNLGDVTLNFSPSRKTKLFKMIVRERKTQSDDFQFKEHFSKNRLNELRKCSLCIAHVRAHSPEDAYERTSEALYEVLGLINLAKDGGKYWRSSSRIGGKLPVSDVLIGPHTTTHFENGELSHAGFWYENWVGGPTTQVLNPELLARWEKRFEQLVVGLSKSPWRESCKTAAVRYFKAFSNPNLEEAFLEGWRLFENISGSRFEKIDDQLRRASNIFEANIEYLLVGRHLGLRRHLLTHGYAIKTNDYETLAFQMLDFVVPFLERYILNGFSFNSTQEFWEFLDLPESMQKRSLERDKLHRRIKLLEKAAEFRGEAD